MKTAEGSQGDHGSSINNSRKVQEYDGTIGVQGKAETNEEKEEGEERNEEGAKRKEEKGADSLNVGVQALPTIAIYCDEYGNAWWGRWGPSSASPNGRAPRGNSEGGERSGGDGGVGSRVDRDETVSGDDPSSSTSSTSSTSSAPSASPKGNSETEGSGAGADGVAGLGGSEEAVVYIAEEFALKG